MQKIMIIGNVTKQPENKNGVVKFGVAVNERYKSKTGEQVEKTEFFNCVVFGKRAETAERYITKGMKIHVEGKQETNEHEGKRYVSLIVSNFEFLSKSEQSSQQGDAMPFDDDIAF